MYFENCEGLVSSRSPSDNCNAPYKWKRLGQNSGNRICEGFSLVELMVVIVIIGLLAGVTTISVRSYMTHSKRNVARLEIAKLVSALDSFYTGFGRHPTNEEGLAALTNKTNSFPDGLIAKVPKDPWGHEFEYRIPGTNGAFEVVCYGADHREGGTGADADISSESLDESSEL